MISLAYKLIVILIFITYWAFDICRKGLSVTIEIIFKLLRA
jgi:hypothetical protein